LGDGDRGVEGGEQLAQIWERDDRRGYLAQQVGQRPAFVD